MFPEPAKSRSKRKPNTTGKHGNVSKEKLVELMATGKTYQEIAELLGYKNKQTVWEYAGAYGIRRPTEKAILNYREMLGDPDFWRIVGYWLAEGCVSGSRKTGSKNVIRFTFSLKEQVFIDDIKTVLGKYGITVTHQVRKSSLMAHCSNKQLAEFLGLFGHGATNKIFPEWAVLLPEQHIKQIIKGYVEGDGTEDNGWERITCSSLSLLEGIRRALLRINVVSSIMDGKTKDKVRWELRFTLCCAPWLGYEGRNIEQKFSFIKENYLWERIKKISICDYDGDVFDIQTPSHDFLSHGMTVHNCDDLSGWLLREHKHEKWTVLNLPAINEQGEALWPEHFPLPILENIRKTLPARDWEALYQQKPFIEEGNIYKRQWWNLWPDTKPLPECEFIIQSWDTAYSDADRKKSSYSARVTLGVFKRVDDEFHNIILIEYWKGRVEYPELRKESLRAYQDYEPDKVIIEKKASGNSLIQDLRRGGLPLATYTPEKDKITRAYAAQSLLENGRLYYPARKWAEDFISALARFPNPDDDDVADAFSQAIIWLQSSFLVAHADDAKRRQREDAEDEDLPSNVTRFKPKKKRAAYG